MSLSDYISSNQHFNSKTGAFKFSASNYDMNFFTGYKN